MNTFELSLDTVYDLVSGFAGGTDGIVYSDAIRWTPVLID